MLLKWTKTELLNTTDSTVMFDEYLTFERESFKDIKRLIGLEDVHVSGEGYYDPHTDLFDVDMQVDGIMITNCAITNEEIDVPFDFDSHVIFSFTDSDDLDLIVVENDIIELIPVIFRLIKLEVPLKAVSSGNIEYPKGEGWRIISEEDILELKKQEIDPRLAKLKEFKFNDDK